MISRSLVLPAALLTATSCRQLERFDTRPGESWCGAMVAAPTLQDGMVPDGTPPRLLAALTLDLARLSTEPGRLRTDDAARGLCRPAPLFDDAPLRALREAQYDQLSLLDFGEGREHNFLAWVDSSCVGPLLAVVSLMKSDRVELRLLKPGPASAADGGAAERPGYAVFQLSRSAQGCGF